MTHQIFRTVGLCGSRENLAFLQLLPDLIVFLETKPPFVICRSKALGARVVFEINAGDFSNVSNTSASSKCGARSVIRFKK